MLCSFCSFSFAGEQEIVDSFKAYVMPKINMVESTYQNAQPKVSYNEGYSVIKPYYTKEISELQYALDVRKTDSLMSPYIGIVEIAKIEHIYKKHNTKEEAMKETQKWMDYLDKNRLKYVYSDGVWKVKTVTFYDVNGEMTDTYDISNEDDMSYYNWFKLK